VIIIPVADYTGTGVGTNTHVVITLMSPNPRTVNGHPVRQDAMDLYTGSDSTCYVTNLFWGKYKFEIVSRTTTPFIFYVGTNTIGGVQIASLITNSAALPPNSGTNYYTQSQTDALLLGLWRFDSTSPTFDSN
jgi:hypothetical protein